MTVQWKLKEYLEKNSVSPYQLMKTTELSSNTIYPMVRNTAERVDKETLTTVIKALRQLTGKATDVGDILRYDRDV